MTDDRLSCHRVTEVISLVVDLLPPYNTPYLQARAIGRPIAVRTSFDRQRIDRQGTRLSNLNYLAFLLQQLPI
jgi:hypothetical protein